MALGLREPGEDAVERVPARDLCEANVRERVERDVEAPQAGLDQRLGEAVEEDTVRRQREVADARRAGEHSDQHR